MSSPEDAVAAAIHSNFCTLRHKQENQPQDVKKLGGRIAL
jgi:hypothetical protein